MTNLDSYLKVETSFCQQNLYSQSYGFSSSHVQMWELDHKEGWAPKSWCFWIVVLEKTLECPLACKEIQPVNPIGNQSWIFTGRTDVEAEAPILWPKRWRADSLEKTPMLRKIEGKRRRGRQRMRLLDNITESTHMNLSKLQEIMEDRGAWWAAVVGLQRVSTTQELNNGNNKLQPGELQSWGCKESAQLRNWTTATTNFNLDNILHESRVFLR